MTVILVCNLNGQSYDKLAERCAISTHTLRSRLYSTGSSDSSCSTSCSTTPDLSDEDSPKYQKKIDLTNNITNIKKSPQTEQNNLVEKLVEVKSLISETIEKEQLK